MVSGTPPTEPDWRISRIQLSLRLLLSSRLEFTRMSLRQTKQAHLREKSVGVAMVIQTPSALPITASTFAKNVPKSHPYLRIKFGEGRSPVMLEVLATSLESFCQLALQTVPPVCASNGTTLCG
jgi:hypothetical protein